MIQDSLTLLIRSIFKTIYENVSSVPFTDIALSMKHLENWICDNTMEEGLTT